MKEVQVQLNRTEDGNYNELWKVVGENQYYARHVYHGQGIWYYVSDPLGYCELDYPVKDDTIFTICDSKGNELFRNSNANEPFPTLEIVTMNEWNKVKEKYSVITEDTEKDFWTEAIFGETTMELNQWLLSFKDPQLYSKEIAEMYGYDENWIYGRSEELENAVIHEYEYLGNKYAIYKIKIKHKICEVEWYEFKAGSLKMGEYEGYIKFFGSWFDVKNIGTMYSKRQAKELVTKALITIYPKKYDWSRLSTVIKQEWISEGYERKYKYVDATELLLKGNYNRKFVSEIIEKEKRNNTFYSEDDPKLLEDYPKLIRDYSLCI
ncbi:hypothetical protein [Clostridium sp.]|uniref:hypothetical protein n=1 Tax=Clostridium sp. TaxID=1506 RepID=UPI003216BF91